MPGSSSSEIEEELAGKVAALLSADPAGIGKEQPLQALGIDAATLAEIFQFVEKTFSLRLVESDLAPGDLSTLRSLAAFIARERAC